jgi:hypothetical protein
LLGTGYTFVSLWKFIHNKKSTMKNSESNTKDLPIVPTAEGHKKAATHYEAAAKSHLEAAKHHESGNHEKAAKSTTEAHEHASHAKEAQKPVVKNHTS